MICIEKIAHAGMLSLGAVVVATLAMTGSASAQQDGDMPLLNGCSSYVDATAEDADRTLNWTYGVEEDARRCLKIRLGQTVTFDGSVSAHPIEALGGTTPNPFAGALSTSTSFTFDAAGGFGFVCIFHEEMEGVIWVVA